VNYFGSGTWYPATILSVAEDAAAGGASYTILFQGETDSQEVTAAEIRSPAQPSSTVDVTGDTYTVEELPPVTDQSLLEGSNDTTTTEGGDLQANEVISGDESARLANYELWASLGRLYSIGGKQFEQDVELAAEYYTMASEEAMKLGKVALAVKYTNYASELEG